MISWSMTTEATEEVVARAIEWDGGWGGDPGKGVHTLDRWMIRIGGVKSGSGRYLLCLSMCAPAWNERSGRT